MAKCIILTRVPCSACINDDKRDTYSVGSSVPVRASRTWMIVFAVRHERAHRWVPLDALDAQPTPSKDAFLWDLREGPDAHDRVVASRGEAGIVSCFVWVRYAAGRQRRPNAEVSLARKRTRFRVRERPGAAASVVSPVGANLEN